MIRKEYACTFAGIVSSAIMVFVGLWQVEIVVALPGDFYFPFFIFGPQSKWFARDIWYAVIMAGWLIGLISAYFLGEVRESRKS